MSRIELKNWHDVPLVVTTPDEEFEIPPGATAFVFAQKMAVRVKQPDQPVEHPQGAPP